MRSATMMGAETVAAPIETADGVDSAVLAKVECLFRAQLRVQRLLPGAALAVYHRGRLVLDLAEGYADT
jgi:CubicO group peptidase (beta-lactamase class C family)